MEDLEEIKDASSITTRVLLRKLNAIQELVRGLHVKHLMMDETQIHCYLPSIDSCPNL
jgi:hypothetical protein